MQTSTLTTIANWILGAADFLSIAATPVLAVAVFVIAPGILSLMLVCCVLAMSVRLAIVD